MDIHQNFMINENGKGCEHHQACTMEYKQLTICSAFLALNSIVLESMSTPRLVLGDKLISNPINLRKNHLNANHKLNLVWYL